MNKIIPAVLLGCLLFAACENHSTQETSPNKDTETPSMASEQEHRFDSLPFAEKKDPICQMPLTAGIADTAVIDGKIYGFCAVGCKESYVEAHRK